MKLLFLNQFNGFEYSFIISLISIFFLNNWIFYCHNLSALANFGFFYYCFSNYYHFL